MWNVKIIEDSVSPEGKRITTFELEYPRFILAELNTHRVFSRNSSSSRAIPVWKLMKKILQDPVYPSFWGENQKGMQASKELEGLKLIIAKLSWRIASIFAVGFAGIMNLVGLHKQIANRVIEPWMWTKTILTSTEWDNFFELRCHPDAQPEMRILAILMRDIYEQSSPKLVDFGNWHLPYVTEEERNSEKSILDLCKISTARCARVSFLTHDGKSPSFEKDINLHERLVGSVPIHASPTEHQATPNNITGESFSKNFKGWIQYRSIVERKNLLKIGD